MSFGKSLRQASLHSLNLFFAALGGALGLVVFAITSGWLSVGIGIGLGLYVALFLAYHNVRSDLDAIKAQLDNKAKNKVIVDAVLGPLHYAVHTLYNNPNDSSDNELIMEWRRQITKWEADTKELLIGLGCSRPEIDSFWDFTWSDINGRYPELHHVVLIDQHRKRVQYRIDALRKLVNRYSDHAVF